MNTMESRTTCKAAFRCGFLSPLAVLASGCAATPLHPVSAGIQLVRTDPEDCQYLGTVEGSQGNWFTGRWTSNRNLEMGARNALLNNAAERGANTVAVITDRAGNTGSWHRKEGGYAQTNVVYVGTAYFCAGEPQRREGTVPVIATAKPAAVPEAASRTPRTSRACTVDTDCFADELCVGTGTTMSCKIKQ